MGCYKLSPFVNFLESHLIPGVVHYGLFHQLTGEVLQPESSLRALLLDAGANDLSRTDVENAGANDAEIARLVGQKFLVANEDDLLSPFSEHVVVRPLQNPAVAYCGEDGMLRLVRLSMRDRLYSPRPNDLPKIIEEELPALAADIFLAANGRSTLAEIGSNGGVRNSWVSDPDFISAVAFLSCPERQLIKLAPATNGLCNPFEPFNSVPRNYYHVARWATETAADAKSSNAAFHRQGIEAGEWEFDMIEPTLNHALRFPTEVLSGFDYGSRFALASLSPDVLPSLHNRGSLEVLEVGGGTGTFARSFLQQARHMNSEGVSIGSYAILDLSPALICSQRRVLAGSDPTVEHIEQDATNLDLGDRRFDVIIANEVIADFHVATVERRESDRDVGNKWVGPGVADVEKYGLRVDDAGARFFVNAGAFEFVERAWRHLKPGGVLVLTEYGSVAGYPGEGFHLNHAEYSIHFGHMLSCAEYVGFECKLGTLKDFLALNDTVPVLNGRDEHIRCLNHVFSKFEAPLPFALITQREFEAKFQSLADRIGLLGVSFHPLRNKFYYGPDLDDFMVLILKKPL